MAQQPPVDQAFLIIDDSRSHLDTFTLGTTPLDEWSACRRDLYLTTLNTNKTIPIHPVGFEPTIPASERSQTNALDRAATGIVLLSIYDGT